MGEEKENKRERYENINIECPLMEKKWGGGTFILLDCSTFLLRWICIFAFVGFYILVGMVTMAMGYSWQCVQITEVYRY